MRVLFAGGGTGGHINPALAVAKKVMEKQPGSQVMFVGTTRGLETELVPKAGFPIKYIDVFGYKRSVSMQNVKAFGKMFSAFSQSVKIIKDFKPDVVMGTGGYVSGPVLAAAALMRYPTIIHEQNVAAGVTSKMLSHMVDVVCVSFQDNLQTFTKAKRTVLTGNPLREEMFRITPAQAKAKLGLDGRPFLVAFGGSLGAHEFNRAIVEMVARTKDRQNFQLLFSTGTGDYDSVAAEFERRGIDEKTMPNVRLVSYIHNMDEVMNAADLVIGRSGAITCCELNALGKPAILIPSPNVTGNHQEFNARALERGGAAIVYTEQELEPDSLYRTVNEMLADPELLIKMSDNSGKMGIKDGTEKIYGLIEELCKKRNK